MSQSQTFDQETNSRTENETNTEVQKSAAVQLETWGSVEMNNLRPDVNMFTAWYQMCH